MHSNVNHHFPIIIIQVKLVPCPHCSEWPIRPYWLILFVTSVTSGYYFFYDPAFSLSRDPHLGSYDHIRGIFFRHLSLLFRSSIYGSLYITHDTRVLFLALLHSYHVHSLCTHFLLFHTLSSLSFSLVHRTLKKSGKNLNRHFTSVSIHVNLQIVLPPVSSHKSLRKKGTFSMASVSLHQLLCVDRH